MILRQVETPTEECLVLIAETLAIQEAIKTSTQVNMDKPLRKVTQVVIDSITSNIDAPNQICNLVNDINSIARYIKNINFTYCNRPVNSLTDK